MMRKLLITFGVFAILPALLLATGSRPRPLNAPGADLAGVHTLRAIGDVDRIRADMASGGRVVIVGGGYIGLEVAATARELGLDVTVLEMADRVKSEILFDLHRRLKAANLRVPYPRQDFDWVGERDEKKLA